MTNATSAVETISSDLFEVLKSVDLHISNPGTFCSASTENAASLSELMRSLFKSSADCSKNTFGPFQELLIEGFDGETIWEELQTRNRPLTRFVKKKIDVITQSIQGATNAKRNAAKAAKKASEALLVKAEEDTEDDEDLESEDMNGIDMVPLSVSY